jgi:NagD protein
MRDPTRPAERLVEIRAFLFDLDGSVIFGRDLARGARECLEWIARRGIYYGFITNNSHQSPAQIAGFLRGKGIDVGEDRIFLPTRAAGAFIAERFGRCRVFVLGSEELAAACGECGHCIIKNGSRDCDVVLVGLDFRFTYRKLKAAAEMLHRGASLVCTNPDISHPGEGGMPVPEAGALLACLQGMARNPAFVVGKPAPWLFKAALERFALPPEAMAIVGDNPDTDLAGGKANGLFTVHLKSDPCEPVSELADLTCGDLLAFHSYLRDLLEVQHER